MMVVAASVPPQRQNYRKRNLIRDGGRFSGGIHIKESLLKNIFQKAIAELCLKMNTERIYCVFCETGCEGKSEAFLQRLGNTVITSFSERTVFKKGKSVKELRPVIPGYVFFSNNREPEWKEIRKYEHIYYPLCYSDNTKELRNNDLRFVKWLIRQNGVIGISKVIREGSRIKIIDGPLKEYEGKITKIKKRQKCAEIEIGTDKIINKIWLSYELIEIKNNG
jgi:transcriptional antiterminator NusG